MKILFCTFLVAISAIACQSNSSKDVPKTSSAPVPVGTTSATVSYKTAKETIAAQEKADPKSFLKIDGETNRKNLLGEWVTEGNIINSATVAKYKDVTLSVKFYDKDKTLLGTEDFQQDGIVEPGHPLSFKVKSKGYSGTATTTIYIKSATTVNEIVNHAQTH